MNLSEAITSHGNLTFTMIITFKSYVFPLRFQLLKQHHLIIVFSKFNFASACKCTNELHVAKVREKGREREREEETTL